MYRNFTDIEIFQFCANDICILKIWISRLSSCVLGTYNFSKRKWDSTKHNLEHIIQWSKRWWFMVGTLPGFVEWLDCCQARVSFLLYIQSGSISETTITAPMCLPNPQVLISHSGPSPLVGVHPVICYVTGWVWQQGRCWRFPIQLWTSLDGEPARGFKNLSSLRKNGYCDGPVLRQGRS
jgi:hypothetical protein